MDGPVPDPMPALVRIGAEIASKARPELQNSQPSSVWLFDSKAYNTKLKAQPYGWICDRTSAITPRRFELEIKMNYSRRTIIKSGVLAAGTTAAIPALSYGRIIGSNEKIRAAVIGLNGRGGSHMQGFKKNMVALYI